MESLYQRGWRLAKEGHGVSDLWGNCSKDSEMDEMLRGMEAYWRGQAAPVPPAGDVELLPARKPDVNRSFEGTDSEWYGNIAWNEACAAWQPHVTRLTAERDGLRQTIQVIDHHLRGHVNDPDPLVSNSLSEGSATTYGLVAGLKRERDGLLAEVKRYKTMSDNYCALNMDAQSELTKALEDLRLEKVAGAAMHKQAEDFKALSWERGQELTKARELLIELDCMGWSTSGSRDFIEQEFSSTAAGDKL